MKGRLIVGFEALSLRFSLDPNSHWVGLCYEQSSGALQAVYLARELDEELMPWHAMVTVGTWPDDKEGEEFFLEALSVDNLLSRLTRFIDPKPFFFFEVPATLGMDVVCRYPLSMLRALFPELSELDAREFELQANSLMEKMKRSVVHSA